MSKLVRSFRPEILENFGNIEHVLKSDKTVVTKLDKSIEKRIRAELEKEYPEIGFDGEEFGKSGSAEQYWLIDPIDGTQNFIRGIEQIGTIIGLVENGEVVLSLIYDPIKDLLYCAKKDQGAWCDGYRISVKERVSGDFLVESTALEMAEGHEILKILRKNRISLIRTHGSATKTSLLISSKIDGVINFMAGGGNWDYAPVILLAEEAGAVITIFDQKSKLETRNFAMLSKPLNSQIVDELRELWKN